MNEDTLSFLPDKVLPITAAQTKLQCMSGKEYPIAATLPKLHSVDQVKN